MWLSPSALHRPASATLLDAFGAALGVKNDHEVGDYDTRTDVSTLVRAKATEMELQMRYWLEARVEVCDASHKTTQQVREIMHKQDPPPVLWRPTLETNESRAWRGTPALLVRADVLNDIFGTPPLLDPATLRICAPPHCPDHRVPCVLRHNEKEEDNKAWTCPRRKCDYIVNESEWTLKQWPRGTHYRAVHLHYGALDVLKDGRTLSQGASLANVRARVLAFNTMLGDTQGFQPPTAYVVGRCYRSSAWKEGPRLDCTALLPQVFHHEDSTRALEEKAAAVRDMYEWPLERARAYLVSEDNHAELRALGWPWQGAARQLLGAPPPAGRAARPPARTASFRTRGVRGVARGAGGGVCGGFRNCV